MRDLAEAQIAPSLELPEPLAPAEVRRLLHELRVNQVQLEMQNEELRRVQAQLDAERARYYELYELAPICYITLDEQGTVVQANLTAATLLGVTRGELIKKPFSTFVYSEDQDIHYLHFKALLATGKPHTCEDLRLIRKDAAPFRALFHGVMDQDSDGKIICRIVISDVTERIEAENQLASMAAYTRSLIEASLDPMVTISAEGKITDVNAASITATGVAREKLIGTDFSDYFTEPDQARQGYRQVFAQGFVTDYPLTIRHSSGHLTDVLYNGTVYRDAGGAVLGVFAAARDVTRQKQAEEALRTLLSLHTATLEATADGILVVDQAGHWTAFNHRFLQLWRIPPEQVKIGDALIIRTYALPQLADPEAFQAKVLALYDHPGESSFDELHFKDGRVFERLSLPQRLGDVVVGRVWSFRDVTPRVTVERSLRQTQELLQAANCELGRALSIERDLAQTDELTRVLNHRALMAQAVQLYDVAKRYHHPLSVLMFDIDNFKQINDTYGHATGDQVLQLVVAGAKGCLRDADIIGRYGGDEFVILAPMTTAQQALAMAERIHAAITAVRVPSKPGDGAVTLSIGIAEMGQPSRHEPVAHLINRADEAMYLAKQAGRNRMERYLTAPPGTGCGTATQPAPPLSIATLRHDAEDRVREMGEMAFRPTAPPPDTALDLPHELQVHQIELEMQNEELRRTQAQLEAERTRYFDLYEMAPVGIISLSTEGLILEANFTAATLLGEARGGLLRQPLTRFILPADQDRFYRCRQQLVATGQPQVCELRMMNQVGKPFTVRLEATAPRDTDNTLEYRVLLIDTTGRQPAADQGQPDQGGQEG